MRSRREPGWKESKGENSVKKLNKRGKNAKI